VNRDVVAPVTPAVVTSPTPILIGTEFCGGTGTDKACEDLGSGTKSSTDEMDIVGLRTPRWVAVDSTPCVFWGTVGHEGGGMLSSGICFGRSAGVLLSMGGDAVVRPSFGVEPVACGGNDRSTSGMVFGGSSVTRVSSAG